MGMESNFDFYWCKNSNTWNHLSNNKNFWKIENQTIASLVKNENKMYILLIYYLYSSDYLIRVKQYNDLFKQPYIKLFIMNYEDKVLWT